MARLVPSGGGLLVAAMLVLLAGGGFSRGSEASTLLILQREFVQGVSGLPSISGFAFVVDAPSGPGVLEVVTPSSTIQVQPDPTLDGARRRRDFFSTEAARAMVAPPGVYGVGCGLGVTITGTQPGAIRFTNLPQLASRATGGEVTVTWQAPASPDDQDWLLLQVRDPADGRVLWRSPLPEAPGALRPGVGSAVVPVPETNSMTVEASVIRVVGRQAGEGCTVLGAVADRNAAQVPLTPPMATAAPVLVEVFPASGGVVSSPRPAIRLRFDRAMHAAGSAVSVSPEPESWVRWWSEDRRELRLLPLRELPPGPVAVILNPQGTPSGSSIRGVEGVSVPTGLVATVFTIGEADVGPKIVSAPALAEPVWGTEAVIQVVADGDSLSYAWFERDTDGTWTLVEGADGPLLRVPGVVGLREFKVRVTDGAGRSVESGILGAQPRVSPPPRFVGLATDYLASPGTRLTLTVRVEDPDGLPVWLDWFEGDTATGVLRGTGDRLEVDAIATTTYQVRASNPMASDVSAVIRLEVAPVESPAQALQVALARAGVPPQQRQPEADPDGDGLSSLWEWAVGSDPARPGGVQRFPSLVLGPNALEVTIDSRGGPWPATFEFEWLDERLQPTVEVISPAVTTVGDVRRLRWTLPLTAGTERGIGRISAFLGE